MEERPSFFKVLISKDFSRQLRLPPAFLQDSDSAVPENVKLRISSGRTWNVKVEETKKGLLCFTRGWQSFAADVGLRFAEFLVFTFDCDRTFQVSVVYQTNACAKKFTRDTQDSILSSKFLIEFQLAKSNCRDGSKAPIDGGASRSDQSSTLCFKVELNRHSLCRIHIPHWFWKAADLKEKKSVRLEYADNQGSETVVKLNHRHWRWFRIETGRGWSKFRKASGMVLGKTYSFEFMPDRNVIQVKEFKKGK